MTAKLIPLLEQEIKWLDEIITILSEEKEHLTTRAFEALEEIAKRKETLSNQLEKSANERIELLKSLSQTTDIKQALQEVIHNASIEEATKIQTLNNQLAEKLHTCRELNSVNGQVIATNIYTRQEVINTLTGQERNDALNVYTATGDIKKSGTGNTLETA